MTTATDSSESLGLRDWGVFHRAPNMMVPDRKLLGPDTTLFAMGSCFALELRTAMMKRGLVVYPDYMSVSYDPTAQVYDKIPVRYALQHFDTFTMRQEFERAFGLWPDRARSFCKVTGAYVNQLLNATEVYQDPTRKMIYGKTPEALRDLSDRIDTAVREGIERAEVFVLTLGLTEAWQHRETGRYLCTPPGAGYGGAEELGSFQLTTFEQNRDNMRAILDQLFARYPDKQVVLSVSPVHLERTYAPVDVGTASTESKSILRAVAGELSRAYPNVTYFPSYEMAAFWRVPVFIEDGRHVRQDFADRVVSAFISAFS